MIRAAQTLQEWLTQNSSAVFLGAGGGLPDHTLFEWSITTEVMPDTSFDRCGQDIYGRKVPPGGAQACPGLVGPCSAEGRGHSATSEATCHIWVIAQKQVIL